MQRFIPPYFLATALLVASGFALNPAFAADEKIVSSMHDTLKERWYTTEVVVFRTSNSGAEESTLLQGERLSAAEERLRAGLASLKDLEESEPDDGFENDPEKAINVLTLDPRDSGDERPPLDAKPWDGIKDYDTADDLNALVARNMATWETELRAQDGEWLPADELTLADAAKKLNKSRGVDVLFHSGWTQSVPARGNGKPIEIEAGEVYTDSLSGEQEFRLSGTITVTLGRYLHVRPTLFYTPEQAPSYPLSRAGAGAGAGAGAASNGSSPGENQIVQQARAAAAAARGETPSGTPKVRDLSSSADSSNRSALDRISDRELADRRSAEGEPIGLQRYPREQEQPSYLRLDQSRRVRSGELHYLDHPELGVLVRITPVQADPRLQEQFALLQ